MKILLSADSAEKSLSTVRMLERLRFSDVHVDIVHALNRLAPPLVEPQLLGRIDEFYRSEEQAVIDDLATIKLLCSNRHSSASIHILSGSPRSELLQYADRSCPELICVSVRSDKSPKAWFGSAVANAFCAHARQSVLVARDATAQEAPLHVVLATDHSEYMERCCELLLHLNPRGIEKLSVITVIPQYAAFRKFPLSAATLLDVETLMRRSLEEKNAVVEDKLRALCPEVTSKVLTGNPSKVVVKHAKEACADLIIVGAQGHDVLERLAIGSVSHSLAANAEQSVLILRPN